MASASSSETDSMASAVNRLEHKFSSTETELTNLERKMELEYGSLFHDDDAIQNHLRRPIQVLQRIQEVKSDFAQIKQEVVEIQKMQGEALNQVKEEFDTLLSAISTQEFNVLQSDVSSEAKEGEQKLLSVIDHMAKKSAAYDAGSNIADNTASNTT